MFPEVTRVASVIIRAVVPVIVGAVISGRRGRCDKARDRPHSSANCRAEGRTVTAGSGSPDGSPTACANETAANETFTGSYGLVQAERPRISPIAITQRIICGLIINLSPTFGPTGRLAPRHGLALNGRPYERRIADLYSDE